MKIPRTPSGVLPHVILIIIPLLYNFPLFIQIYGMAMGIPVLVWSVRKAIQYKEQRRARIEAAMHADMAPL